MTVLNKMLFERYLNLKGNAFTKESVKEISYLRVKTIMIHFVILNLYAMVLKKRNYKYVCFSLLGVTTGYVNSFNYTHPVLVRDLMFKQADQY